MFRPYRHIIRTITTKKSPTGKLFPTPAAAVADIPSGARILIGGFGPCGLPQNLIQAIKETNITGLHIVTNNAGLGPIGMSLLVQNHQVKSAINSYIAPNKDIRERFQRGNSS
jgi:acyl CoA:acetate/3-ketoacid CoA transferase alpha subunit